MEEKKDYAKERELDINEVEIVKEMKEDNEVKKVVLTTSKGWAISYKPKKKGEERSEYRGITTIRPTQNKIALEELPEKIFQIKKIIDTKNVCKVKVSYFIWQKPVDGVMQTYRYMMESQFNELAILSNDKVGEELIE